jgi:hypothetical protein
MNKNRQSSKSAPAPGSSHDIVFGVPGKLSYHHDYKTIKYIVYNAFYYPGCLPDIF